MKYHGKNSLCLTYAEYVACVGIETYKSDKKRGNIIVIGRGGNGSEILIDFESMPEERRKAVVKKYGDPYTYILTQPFTNWIELNRNEKAYRFYNKEYKLPNGLHLPEKYRDDYTTAITYLDAIKFYTTDKIALKRDFNITMAAFWEVVGRVIKAEGVKLPANRGNLQTKLAEYKEKGFDFIIEAFRFGNDNSKKVKDQLAEDVLMKLIENGNKVYDDVIANAYNLWASENNRPSITAAAVGYRRRTKYVEVAYARDGKAATYTNFNKHIKQHRPSAPLMLVNSDDNVLDLYFTDISYYKGRKVVNNYYRPVMYVVIDTYNDYPLGYAIGESVTIELIKQAYRNAMQHVYELTGGYHLWHQIKTDKWSIDPELKGELATFFKNQSHFFPAQVAQSKYVERVFAAPLHRVLKVFPNYSGHNISATGKNARINPDTLQKGAKNHPDKAFNGKVIEMVINTMRHTVQDGGKTKQEIWLEAFNSSDFCAKRAIELDKKIELYGVKHPEAARLMPSGINFQLNNQKYSFEVPAALFPQFTNRSVVLIYDPADMSKVLVTDTKGLRFVAEPYATIPAALADFKEGDRKRLDEKLAEKQHITDTMVNFVEERAARIERAGIDAASLLQAGVLTKAINHQAQRKISGDVSENFDFPHLADDRPYNLLDAM